MYANDGLLLVKAIVTEKNIQALLNLLVRFFSSKIKLRKV